ncbi:hypothetical protein D1007_57486 [Hordeum vulgare]|nr:hypothetical protein D1007_57486 [Hordeum vulgare]
MSRRLSEKDLTTVATSIGVGLLSPMMIGVDEVVGKGKDDTYDELELSIGPNTFVMRFPSPRDVDKACFAQSMNIKSCGAVINLRKWSESVGAKGVLNVAWVNVSNITLDKRHEKNIAYVGSLVGVTLEIDKAAINRPESVRIKLRCRDAEDIPASAEGVLGGHFYDFFFSVDNCATRN